MKNRISIIIFIFFLQIVFAAHLLAGQRLSALDIQGELLSWNEGPAKDRIVSFVESVSDPASKNFVPVEQRRAFFDMDGTILCEKPGYIEGIMTQQRLLEKVNRNPRLKAKTLYQAVLENNTTYFRSHIKAAIAESFAGETLKFYTKYCRRFLYTQIHPRFNRPYVELFYAPMIELIDYLKDREFKVYIVSTSQQEFIRSISKDILNISRDQIIGTMVAYRLHHEDKSKKPAFIRQSDYFDPYNANENKVVRIRERGLLPAIFAFGNSSGDLAMLEATAAGGGPHLVSILDHDDPQREYEYHKANLLKKAQSSAWNIVSIKQDFNVVFRPNQ